MKVRELVDLPAVRTVVRLSDTADEQLALDMVRAFVPTAEASRALEVILSDLSEGHPRGYFIQGNYGSGKSHLLGLLSLLLQKPHLWTQLCRGTTMNVPGAVDKVRETLGGQRFLVAGLSLVDHGGSESLEGMVWDCLSQSLGEPGLPRRGDVTFVQDLLPIIENRYGEELGQFLAAESESLSGPPERVAAVLETFLIKKGLPYRARFDRSQALDTLRAEVAGRGYQGVVLLVDELSEFLRSKPDGRSFAEDVRFLQFLAERADFMPLWIVITLQEAIEATGELKTDTLRKIKDRYAAPFVLGGAHIRQLISRRLIVQKPGTGESLTGVLGEIQAAFPGFSITHRELAEIYPVHPDTVELLESLKVLFSQHRGVVDFIHYQLGGDRGRDIEPHLDRPATSLLTPDLIYDHFRDRIRENPETAPFHDRVEAFYLREAGKLFQDPDDRAMALRLVKILILASICPLETTFTARKLAEMLLEPVSSLDPEVNYQYVAGILKRMHRDGAYITTVGEGNDSTYSIDLEADVALLIKNRLELALGEIADADGRLWTHLGSRIREPYLPLAEWLSDPNQEVSATFQRTRRRGRWVTGQPSEEGMAGLERVLREGRAEDLDFVIYAVASLHPRERHFLETLDREAFQGASPGLVFWVPRQPTGEEAPVLKRALAAVLLETSLAEETSSSGQRLKDHLDEVIGDLVARATTVMRQLFFEGQFMFAGGASLASPTAWDYLPAGEMRDRLVDQLLRQIHPRHSEISPHADTLLSHHLAAAWEHLIKTGRIKIGPGGNPGAERVATGFLVPMGLCRRMASEMRIECDPANPLVAFVLDAAGTDQVSLTEVYQGLRSGSFGISRESFQLLIMVLIAQGLVTAHRGGRRVNVNQMNPGQVSQVEFLTPGEVLSERFARILAACPLLPQRLRVIPFNYPAQRAAWNYLVENRTAWEAGIRSAMSRLRDLEDYRLLSGHDLRSVTGDATSVLAVLDEIKVSYSSREGLERFAAAYHEVPGLDAAWGRVRGWSEFLSERLEPAVMMFNYLSGAHPQFDKGDGLDPLQVEAEEIEEHRERITTALGQDESALTDGREFPRWQRAFELFRAAYSRLYLEEHARQVGSSRFEPYRHITSSRSYRALSLLSGIETISIANDLVRVDRALKAVMDLSCTALTADVLHRRPTCHCGFVIGQRVDIPAPRDIWDMVEKGLREYLEQLGRSRVREKLIAYMTGMSETGQRRATEPLRRVLAVDPDDPQSLRGAADLITRPVISMINEALAGKTVVTERNLESLYEALVGRTFSQERLLELVQEWIAGGDNLDETVFIKVEGTRTPGGGEGRRPFGGTSQGP